MDEYTNRLNSLFDNSDMDYVILLNAAGKNSNFLYMSGLKNGLFEGAILLLSKNKMELLTSILEYEEAIIGKNSITDVIKISNREDYAKHLFKKAENKIIALDFASLPYKSYKNLKKLLKPKKIIDISGKLQEMRLIKTENELKQIKKAASITKQVFNVIENDFKIGVTELDLAAKIDYIMMTNGAQEPSFTSIVSFGSNAALPHHMSSNAKLKENSFVLLDIGSKYNNYCSDMTRTFIFKPDKKSDKYKRMSDMYDVVLEAQKRAFNSLKEGVLGKVPHNIAMDYINNYKNGIYKGKFIHSLGHSIGLDVHDNPSIGLSSNVNVKIKQNMVFSDEPGIYINGFGGVRIEDDVLITKNGAKFL